MWGLEGLGSGFRVRRFPKIWGTSPGVPIMRSIVCWGLYWSPFILATTEATVPS